MTRPDRPLRIGIDAHGVGGHSLGLGNETYFRSLIAALLLIDPENEYHVFANHPDAVASLLQGRSNARAVSLRPHSQWVQRPVSLPLYANHHGLDVLHVPFIRPPFVRAKTVITVHDISFESHPEHYGRIERWRMRTLVPRSCRAADLVLTVSEFSRRDLIERYGLPPEKVVVSYNAADGEDEPAGAAKDAAPEIVAGLTGPYLLYVGMIQPRKNLTRLVSAFDRIRTRAGLPHHLVLAGKRGWGNDELMRTVESLRHRDAIHFTGFVSAATLARLRAGASGFVFPSLFEAFGIPPLEAQRAGLPVMVADTSCFPEIYGDSVLYCDAYDVESMAEAIGRLVGDPALRETLIRRGAERVSRYSWSRTAAVVLDAYRGLARRPHSAAALEAV